MKQWDRVVEGYLARGESRGLSRASLSSIRDELERCGCWLKRRGPKPRLEEVDGQMLIEYLRSRTRFRAKSTVSGVTSKKGSFLSIDTFHGAQVERRYRNQLTTPLPKKKAGSLAKSEKGSVLSGARKAPAFKAQA